MVPAACAPALVLGVESLGAAALGLGAVSAGAGLGVASAVDGVDGVEDELVSEVLADGSVGSLATVMLFDEDLELFADFLGAAFGALGASVVSVAVAGAGAGVAAAGVLASATTVDFVSVLLVVSAGDERFDDARFDVAAAGTIATDLEATS